MTKTQNMAQEKANKFFQHYQAQILADPTFRAEQMRSFQELDSMYKTMTFEELADNCDYVAHQMLTNPEVREEDRQEFAQEGCQQIHELRDVRGINSTAIANGAAVCKYINRRDLFESKFGIYPKHSRLYGYLNLWSNRFINMGALATQTIIVVGAFYYSASFIWNLFH